MSTESDYETLPGASLPTKSFDFWEGVLVREPFAADLPRSIEQANTTFTTPRPLQEDGDECFERRNFERREREVASNFNVDAGDTERGFGWYVTPSLKPARRPHQNRSANRHNRAPRPRTLRGDSRCRNHKLVQSLPADDHACTLAWQQMSWCPGKSSAV